MEATFFPTQADFRKWLIANYKSENELIVGFYKVHTKKPSISWSQSVDEALCFGWIDGIRRRIDDESYSIRFTPRRRTSIWSAVNIRKVEELEKQGLMLPEGLEAFSHRNEQELSGYTHEKASVKLALVYKSKFKDNNLAWDFFVKQAPSYKKMVIFWIMSAKQEKTRLSRLAKAISASEKHERMW